MFAILFFGKLKWKNLILFLKSNYKINTFYIYSFFFKEKISASNLNDHEQHQNNKIEVLVDLFAHLRDQIEKLNERVDSDSSKIEALNKKLKDSEEKTMYLESVIVKLKTENKIQFEALTERSNKLEEKFKASNQSLSQQFIEIKQHVEQQNQIQNRTFIEQIIYTNEKFSSISNSVNELNERVNNSYMKKTTTTFNTTSTATTTSKLL